MAKIGVGVDICKLTFYLQAVALVVGGTATAIL